MENTLLSVVICTFNRAESLRTALNSVLQQKTDSRFRYEAVVIDDGSTDNTADVVREIAENTDTPVQYCYEGSKSGIAMARNCGIRESNGDWVVFFDDDQLADPGWLKHLVDVAEEQDTLCIGGARRLNLEEEQLRLLGPVCRAILGEESFGEKACPLAGKQLPTTGNLMISKRVFDSVGTFNASFLSSGEDADLIRRTRDGGFEIWTTPDAVVAHIIPEYRLTPRYFCWVSLRWGNQFALFDFREGGYRKLLLHGAGRAIQAVVVTWPRLCLALLRGARPRVLDMNCLLWRAEGYLRTGLYLTSPRLFPQEQFLNSLDFRNERLVFDDAGDAGAEDSGSG
jgi:glycosyltransferase involved in cell wall biosynthesis